MADLDFEQTVADQRALIAELSAQVQALSARLGPAPEPEPVSGGAFPRVVYRAWKKPNPTQVDHPGNDAKLVKTQRALDDAVREGWQLEPLPYVYLDPEPEPAPLAKKGGKR